MVVNRTKVDIPQIKNQKKLATKTLRHEGFTKFFWVLSLLSLLWRKIFFDLKDALFENPLCLCAFVAICCFSFWGISKTKTRPLYQRSLLLWNVNLRSAVFELYGDGKNRMNVVAAQRRN